MKDTRITHSNKNKESFYQIFLDELPDFMANDTAAHVVGECIRAAKRAERKVLEGERD